MDVEKFLKQKYTDRTAFIAIPELKKYFGEEENPGLTVKAIDGRNLYKILEESRADLQKIAVDILKTASPGASGDALVNLLGGRKAIVELEKDIQFFIEGLLEPDMKPDEKLRFAAKLSREHVFDFRRTVEKIKELTGAGRAPEG